jgi:transposase
MELRNLLKKLRGPTEDEIRELPVADRPCPRCGATDDYRKHPNSSVHRCLNCKAEGIPFPNLLNR